MTGSARSDQYEARVLGLFAVRCDEIAARVAAGLLPIVDGVDLLYEAAIWSGLADAVGDDRVQQIMSDAFMRTRRAP
jgi:hypothetical protein